MSNKNSIKLKGDIPEWLQKITAADLIASQKAFSSTQFCASPGCIENKFQWCHVIPEAAQLNRISKDGKVSWLPMREKDRWTLHMFWEETPTARALVFKGFCNKCDNDLFGKIDSELEITKETSILLAYRSACYFNWRYAVDLNSAILRKDTIKEMIEKNPGLPKLKETFESSNQKRVDHLTERRDEIEKMMISIRSEIDKQNFNFIQTRIYDFGENLPIRYSLAGTFVTSLLNESIFVSQIEHHEMPMLFLHILHEGNSTKLIFSWLSTVPKRYPEKWLSQFEEYSNSGHLADVLLKFMFISNHGLVFWPSFSKSFTHEGTNYLTAPLSGQVYHGLKPEITRICNPPYFNYNWKVKNVTANYIN